MQLAALFLFSHETTQFLAVPVKMGASLTCVLPARQPGLIATRATTYGEHSLVVKDRCNELRVTTNG